MGATFHQRYFRDVSLIQGVQGRARYLGKTLYPPCRHGISYFPPFYLLPYWPSPPFRHNLERGVAETSVVEDRQIELAVGVGEDVDLDDFSVPDREAPDRELLSVAGRDERLEVAVARGSRVASPRSGSAPRW